MSDDRAAAAHRRAEEAGARVRALRQHLDAVSDGTQVLHGSSADDVDDARQHAVAAHQQLRRALISSADAHDRAADAEQMRAECGDPDGAHGRAAAEHRRAAVADRELLAALDREKPRSPEDPPAAS